MSSHFYVIEFVEVEGACVGMEVYSSKTAAWIFKESKWGEGSIVLRSKLRSFFLNGFMHMVEYSVIVAVDMEGKTWRTKVVLKCPSIKLRVTCVCVVLIFAIGLGF
jgi:hypothetical protein